MSGGEAKGEPDTKRDAEIDAKETLGGYEDIVEGLSDENEVEDDEAALKAKGGEEAGPETVLDKSQTGER